MLTRVFFWLLLSLLLLPFSQVNYSSNLPHLQSALKYVGVKEKTGKNDGPEVEMFLKSVGRKRGDAWCAAFVSYNLDQGNVLSPTIRSGLARSFKKDPNLIDASEVIRGRVVSKGSIVGWEKANTVFGHLGFITEDWKGKSGKTVEGNTSSGTSGSQSDGDGVYLRTRTIVPTSYFRIRWFVPVAYKIVAQNYIFNVTPKSFLFLPNTYVANRNINYQRTFEEYQTGVRISSR